MMDYWPRFAATGDPNGSGAPPCDNVLDSEGRYKPFTHVPGMDTF
jgi:hypothetical protein